MDFSAGNWVILRHSSAKGIIARVIDNNMVMVYIQADDMEIPINVEDIQLYEEYILDLETANEDSAKKEETTQETSPKQPQPTGLYLGFEPVAGMDGTTSWFGISILNNSGYDILFYYLFETKAGKKIKKEAKLNNNATYEANKMLFDDLNDSPKIRLEFRQVTTAGIEPPVTKEIKPKPKKLLMVKDDIYLIKIDHDFEKALKKREVDLKSYTKENAKPIYKKKKQYYQYGSMNLREKVEFNNEIDLHIRKLRPNYKSLKKSQILNIQLDHFDAYIAKAIRLGVDRVFAIHGMGEGKLKNMIASRLIQNPQVKSFKNEYHHKYGWGATEVIF